MLNMLRSIFTSIATASNAANNVAKAASYHSIAYEKTALISAAAKYRDQKKQYEVSEEDISSLLA